LKLQPDNNITVKDDLGNKGDGKTDNNGTLTLPG